MRWLSRLRFLLPALFTRKRIERDLDDELSFHVDMMTADNVRRGMPPEGARRAALVTFGGVDRYKEETRDTRGLSLLEEIVQDLRVSLRLLRKSPQFTFAALFTLALGIGANTAIFSVVNTVLLRESPFADPDRLLMVWETDRASKTSHEPASWPDIIDLRERSRTVAAFGALVAHPGTLTGVGEPERVTILSVTPNVPELLGVRALIGRTFRDNEGAPGGALYGLLSEEYWRRRFNADQSILGRSLLINDRPITIVGVLPAEADLGIRQIHAKADYGSPLAGPEVELWLAFESSSEITPRSTHPFLTIGRLAPTSTVQSAQAELDRIMADIERAFPENVARGVNLEQYDFVTFGPVRPALLVLLGAVALVLLVACVNVAKPAAGAYRRPSREVAVRRALGAATGRITRQFLVEGLVLTVRALWLVCSWRKRG
jgi:putative ABC transport system permease protein